MKDNNDYANLHFFVSGNKLFPDVLICPKCNYRYCHTLEPFYSEDIRIGTVGVCYKCHHEWDIKEKLDERYNIVTITGEIDVSEIKRCYIDAIYSEKCPECFSIVTNDFSENYIMYPQTGYKAIFYMECENCGHEIIKSYTVKNVSLTLEIEEVK